jgi:nucleotidyltransferase/DNA polymerase involved in DNA repair
MGVKSVGDIHPYTLSALTRRFGRHGIGLYYLSRGIDSRRVEEGGPAKSISREHTFSKDVADRQIWEKALLRLSREVAWRVRKKRLRGCTVVFTFRLPNFHKHTRQLKLDKPTCLAKVLFDSAKQLMRQNLGGIKKLRLIGVGLTDFTEYFQPSLFDILDNTQAQESTENAMDAIWQKFGQQAIFFGGEA